MKVSKGKTLSLFVVRNSFYAVSFESPLVPPSFPVPPSLLVPLLITLSLLVPLSLLRVVTPSIGPHLYLITISFF